MKIIRKERIISGLLICFLGVMAVFLKGEAGYVLTSSDEWEDPEYEVNVSDNFEYEEYLDHICILGYWGSDPDVSIPEELNGKPVTQLKTSAFEKHAKTAVRSLVIPDSVKWMGSWSFSDCSMLESVVLPSGLKIIPSSAFQGCSSLKQIVIPDGVEIIGSFAFKECISLEKVFLPGSLISIYKEAFSDCRSLEKVQMDAKLSEVGNNCFSGTPWLEESGEEFLVIGGVLIRYNGDEKNIVIPDHVSVIGEAFHGNQELESVTIHSQVTAICEEAFAGCTSLKDITLPGNLRKIGTDAFRNTPWLENQKEEFVVVGDGLLLRYNGTSGIVKVPEEVRAIYSGAFQNSSVITSISLPDTLEEVGENAFAGCTEIKEIVFPDSVKTFGRGILDSSGNIKDVTLPAREEIVLYTSTLYTYDWNYRLHIPETVESIRFFYNDQGEEILPSDKEFFDIVLSEDWCVGPYIVICGTPGSYAEEFAEKWGLAFAAEDGKKDSEAVRGTAEAGFDTPEDVMLAFVEGLQQWDLEKMLSAYAIEAYVDHFQLETEIEQISFYYFPTEAIPVISDYSRKLNMMNRRYQLLTGLRKQYLSLKEAGDGELPESIELKGFIDPARFFVREDTDQHLQKFEERYAGDISYVAAWLVIDGRDYLIFLDVIRYEDCWYGLTPGERCSGYAEIWVGYDTGGIVSFEEVKEATGQETDLDLSEDLYSVS